MSTRVVHYSSTYSSPFFTGAPSATSLVPGLFDLALDGHPYLLNKSHDSVGTISAWFREESPEMLRAQADQSDEPGEQSLSPSTMWRRSAESWHKGAGQIFFDRKDSDRARFRSSKGIDVWDRWEAKLLEKTSKVDTFSGGAGSSVIIVNSTGTARAYASSGGNNLRTSPDPLSSWSAVTGIPGTNCTSIATDGRLIYSAWGTNGIYTTDSNAGPTTAASFVTGTVSRVAYLKARLIAAQADKLYEITAGGALPAAFFDHVDANWTWTAFAEGQGFIYAAGSTGSYSTIYKILVDKQSTALTIGPVATSGLPLGETVLSMHGSFGLVFLGTNKGVRMATILDTGDLQIGDLIALGVSVRSFAAWDRFVWFTWENFDAVSSGLGRLDPSIINDALAPAYASDVMATVTGTVNSVAILPGVGSTPPHPVFTIDGSGVWSCVVGSYEASGELRTGIITYGVVDNKAAAFLDLRHKPLPAASRVDVSLISDDVTTTPIGTSNVAGSTAAPPMSGQQKFAELFELVFTLVANVASPPIGPTIRRWTLRAIPAPSRPSQWTLPLIFKERLKLANETNYPFDPLAELEFLRDLKSTQRVVNLQLGKVSYQVLISDLTFLPDRNTGGEAVPSFVFTGTLIVTVSEISG